MKKAIVLFLGFMCSFATMFVPVSCAAQTVVQTRVYESREAAFSAYRTFFIAEVATRGIYEHRREIYRDNSPGMVREVSWSDFTLSMYPDEERKVWKVVTEMRENME